MQTISIFPNAQKVNEPYDITIDKVVERIRTGKSKALIDKVRAETNKSTRNELKKKLPSICFSGTFSKRTNNSLLVHSGLIAIDFDHLGDRYNFLRDQLIKDKYTFLLFRSPSGDGLKLIIKIPASLETHRRSSLALTDYYKDEKLDEFADIARICYESHDPDIYYNPDSEIFTTLKEVPEVQKIEEDDSEAILDTDVILANIEKWLNRKDEYYKDGNKYKFLVKILTACNRFGIPKEKAEELISYKYYNAAEEEVKQQDIKNLTDKIYKHYKNNFQTARFTELGQPIERATKKELSYEVIDISEPLTDVVYLDSVRDSMLNSFKTGQSRGLTTHFNLIDNHFRWKRGELTLMHGIMNQGKSTMVAQLCLMKAVFCGFKYAFFSPEQDPPDDFYDDLVHMYIGENTQKHFSNQMSEADYNKGMDFVKDHFFYIYPENDSPTPDYINIRFVEVIKRHGVDGCIIDPYNQLDNDIRKNGGREDLYLSAFLSQQKRLAQQYKIFMIIVAHPKGGLTKKPSGDYEKPNVYDLAGGAMWSNKCDNVLCTYRPYYTSEKDRRDVQFTSQKIKKHKLCGTPGDVDLIYKSPTMRYYEMDGQTELPNPLDKKTEKPALKSFYEKKEEDDELELEPLQEEAPF